MKKFLFPAMLLSAAIVGCAEDESTAVGGSASGVDNSDLVSINVYAGTTKGYDTTTSTLEGDDKNIGYVLLHIDDNAGDAQSYAFTYSQDDLNWYQSADEAVTWSSITFPANFYSLYDEAALGEGVTFYDDGEDLSDDYAQYANYTVTGASEDHKDLVYHASRLSAIPAGGVVSVYHRHALSKIHLYASTGDYYLYVARVRLVNIDGTGTVTIKPLDASQISTSNGVSWDVSDDPESYQYFYIANANATEFYGNNKIINGEEKAPLMIIPQDTKGASFSGSSSSLEATNDNSGSYVEVIYYLTDKQGMAIAGYSSVSAMPNASDYKDEGQVLYVAGAFSLDYDFEANTEYDITLGLGVEGSTGGTLLYDYYVDKDGGKITLTKICDDGEEEKVIPEVPEIDEGDDILGDGDDDISIIVSAYDWTTGSSIDMTTSTDDSTDDSTDETTDETE